jgi:hypothetical protein
VADNKIWLDVAFAEKDEAKAHGARWDPTARRRYAPRPGITALDRWQALPESTEAFKHLCTITGLPADQVGQYIDAASALWRRHSAIAGNSISASLSGPASPSRSPLPPLSTRICPAKFFAASDAVNV